MIKLPTYKDIRIGFVIAISFMTMGAIPVIAYFVNIKKFPAFLSDSFFIVLISSIFFFVGLSMLISSIINLKKLNNLNHIKTIGTDDEVRKYEEEFKEHIRLKGRIIASLIPLSLLLPFTGLLIYQIKKSTNMVTIFILSLPVIFLLFVFIGLLYDLFKHKKHKD